MSLDGVARRHYAATNAAEFFAELSTAYLCRDDEDYNKWEPHNQRQLWQFDPETCKLLERMGAEILPERHPAATWHPRALASDNQIGKTKTHDSHGVCESTP